MLGIALGCAAATVFLFTKLPVSLIPGEDRGFFFAFVNLPSGMAPEKISQEQKKLESLIRPNPHIENFLSLNFEGKLIFLTRLNPLATRPPQQEIIGEVQALIDAIPGTQTFIQPYQLINLDIDFGNAGQYQMAIKGLEFKDVESSTEKLVKELQANSSFAFAQSSLRNDSPKLEMEIDEELSHKLGFGKQEIQGLLQNAFGQASVHNPKRGQRRIHLHGTPLRIPKPRQCS